ncbi:hypothetical protein NQ314_004969 [Rhamnusium bicolor]|uniref:Uncharacterized protein n=1 Tax=Rhamnusium bicolor TaxID=1586634 RepID=A0AAV8ZJM8_9CUCU|nr:hypothetical protein NQ314_004969 [Rhamnusium bicolor]
MECAPVEAKKKMESMLASFRREKAKGKATGKGRHKIYVSKWFAFSRLAFLLDRDEPRTTIDTVEEENTGPETESEREKLENEEAAINSQDGDEISTQTAEISTPRLQIPVAKTSFTPLRKRKRPPEPEVHPKVDEGLGILKTAVSINALKADGCSVYGQHVACKLRGYTNKTRNIVKHHINNVLFNADMGQYDIVESTSRSTSNSNLSVFSQPVRSFLQFESIIPSPDLYKSSATHTPVPTPSPQHETTAPSTHSYPMSATLVPQSQTPT